MCGVVSGGMEGATTSGRGKKFSQEGCAPREKITKSFQVLDFRLKALTAEGLDFKHLRCDLRALTTAHLDFKHLRLTLLLGPPGSGKTTLLKALTGVLEKDLRVTGQILGLDICADIMVGDVMRRGISGGQKKRVTTWEMLFGPAKVFFMDDISTGLDSSTTFQIVKYMRQMVHIMDEVTSRKDQEQYWYKKNEPYHYVSVPEMPSGRAAERFTVFSSMGIFNTNMAVSRIQVVSNSLGTFAMQLVLLLGGFIVAKDDIVSWMKWGYYISPLMYGQNAIAVNEFLDERWNDPNTDTRIDQPTVGKVLLASRGMFVDGYMYGICVFVLFAYSIFLSKRGMLLPFKPLSLAFEHVNYYVDMPPEMKSQGIIENRLQLLRDVSGAFRPGVLTALVGGSDTK
ncbi:hypothetical protein POM88_025656 [Heracleum sosnowskyi]|uniref:AAA+ ATPase domain-containing protein n=1 Tax=Heracleum sosnowskyi TaxID=360622 RepID=A0AAD8I6J5_9APIA|nr:hypothetical protein POM88_025656 [Heracleum sosnowskyi]